MPLTDTFVKQVKHNGSVISERYADGGGLYLRVKAAGKYWRLDYRIDGKPQTLALGVYPEVSLAKARQRREKARGQLADGVNPSKANREEKQARSDAASNDFTSVASAWLTKTDDQRVEVTTEKLKAWLANDVNPYIGKMPIYDHAPRSA